MMLLISSRIIFTFSDVSDSGKEAVAVLLIVFLVLILLRMVGENLRRRLTSKAPILITPGFVNSLEEQDSINISQALMNYHIVHRQRVMEIDPDFFQNTKAANVLASKSQISLGTIQTGNIPSARPGRVRVVSTPLDKSPADNDPSAAAAAAAGSVVHLNTSAASE
jgi:hypothetical protein